MKLLSIILSLILVLCSCGGETQTASSQESFVTLENIPQFDNKTAYVVVNNNVPFFTPDEITNKSYEKYSPLDSLGRCGVAVACVGIDIMPTEDRTSIGQVKPSGWQTVKYDNVDGKYLYNRCHLIGFQLTGENANAKNLITGTRFLNIQGMLPFENMVADYVKEENAHVMYRVTPIFEGDNLVASGVLLEGWSVEDNGESICFNVYAYNAQPDIVIDYKTGESRLADISSKENETESIEKYVLNTNTKKFHKPTCSSAKSMSGANKKEVSTYRQELIDAGYKPCGSCNP